MFSSEVGERASLYSKVPKLCQKWYESDICLDVIGVRGAKFIFYG
jgi:hypothetical protein